MKRRRRHWTVARRRELIEEFIELLDRCADEDSAAVLFFDHDRARKLDPTQPRDVAVSVSGLPHVVAMATQTMVSSLIEMAKNVGRTNVLPFLHNVFTSLQQFAFELERARDAALVERKRKKGGLAKPVLPPKETAPEQERRRIFESEN